MGGLNETISMLSSIEDLNDQMAEKTKSKDYALELKRLQQQQDEKYRQAQRNAEVERQKIEDSENQAEAERQKNLQKAIAAQRAKYGARGISVDGSAEAVFRNYLEESRADSDGQASKNKLRLQEIENNLSDMQKRNLFELEYMKQQQRIDRAFS